MALENQIIDSELFEIFSDHITKLNESLQRVVQEACIHVLVPSWLGKHWSIRPTQ
jgi:hypothetical protein